jgi:hypothetical protein
MMTPASPRRPCQKDVVFAQFLSGQRGLLNPSITRWASMAISTHRVLGLADEHGQVMRYFSQRLLPVTKANFLARWS